ncbi:MAG: HD-GYP domain-containing protein [Spirochaetaceae bacterium]|jgi:HD-GYP domain-containing protein (c-di-GMP phosphodiesterase class II)|nr:HD-GYP domain-containing protein [Spirochaetaceae bacterium]
MKEYEVKDIPLNHFFSAPLMLDENFILASPEIKITEDFISLLKEWDFTVVSSAGEPQGYYSGGGEEERHFVLNDAEKVKEAERYYAGLQQWTGAALEKAAVKQPLRFYDAAEKIKEMIEEIGKNRRFLLQIQKNVAEVSDEDFLISHAVKSAVISVIIGMSMKLPAHKLIELGVAALLHEIGMTRLPPYIYLGKGSLKPEEQDLIYAHPKIGYEILKMNDFPMAVCAPALEHHERENGSGYPYKLRGNAIGLYSKIIAVACSYEAITTKRPHKKSEDGYHGMLRLLRNEGKKYDENVLNHMLRSLSIYPIGQFVMLSNKKKAQVIDVNPDDSRNPIVQVFDEQTVDGKNRIIVTERRSIYITNILTEEEIQELQVN